MSREMDEVVAELLARLYPDEVEEYLDSRGVFAVEDTPAGVAMLRSVLLMRVSTHEAPDTNLRVVLAELLELEAVADGEEPYAGVIAEAVNTMRHKISTLEGDYATARLTREKAVAGSDSPMALATALLARCGPVVQSGNLAELRDVQREITDLIDRHHFHDRVVQQLLVVRDHIENLVVMRFDVPRSERKAVPTPADLPTFDREIRLANEATTLLAEHASLDDAIDLLRQAESLPGPPSAHRPAVLMMLGNALMARFLDGGARDDLAAATSHLEDARSLIDSVSHSAWPDVARALGKAYLAAGRTTEGVEVGLDGLRGHAWSTLLQPDLGDAQHAARDAVGFASEVARAALRAGMGDAAVTALESGRALLLFASLETKDLRSRLVAVGREDLAEEWSRFAGVPVEGLPADLRRRLIAALAGFDVHADGSIRGGGGDRLTPPGLPRIRAALSRLGCDALIYLLPGNGAEPGRAVMVPATDEITWLALPDLTTEQARRQVGDNGRGFREVDAAHTVEDDVGAWAWRVAVEPVLRHLFDDGAQAQVVLVPFGELSLIPWHAARSADRTVHAVDRVRFSYAPSARLLCDVAERPPVPPGGGGLVLGDPDPGRAEDDLPAARAEALAVARVFYHDATYMGRLADDSPAELAGTKAELLAWIDDPDGGVVAHFACHGVTRPGDAYLLLAGGDRLRADELVEALPDKAGRTFSLAVLAACRTGEPVRGYDEAFSLGSAFLTAGFRSVISTLWSVPDESTSVLMFMFHHFLQVGASDPATPCTPRRCGRCMTGPRRSPCRTTSGPPCGPRGSTGSPRGRRSSTSAADPWRRTT